METKVLSFRVPKEIAEMIENTCKHRNVNKSVYLKELVSTPKTIHIPQLKNGGVLPVKYKNNDLVEGVLSGVGGTGAGLLTYGLLSEVLPTSWDKDKREGVAIASGIVAGLFTGLELYKLMKE